MVRKCQHIWRENWRRCIYPPSFEWNREGLERRFCPERCCNHVVQTFCLEYLPRSYNITHIRFSKEGHKTFLKASTSPISNWYRYYLDSNCQLKRRSISEWLTVTQSQSRQRKYTMNTIKSLCSGRLWWGRNSISYLNESNPYINILSTLHIVSCHGSNITWLGCIGRNHISWSLRRRFKGSFRKNCVPNRDRYRLKSF